MDYAKKAKNRTALKIVQKYREYSLAHTRIATKQTRETYIRKLTNVLTISCPVERRLEAERIIKWCSVVREKYESNIKDLLKKCRPKIEVCLTRAVKCSELGDKVSALCGKSKHTSSSESYFAETAYHIFDSSYAIMMNSEGRAVSILPLSESKKESPKTWCCTDLCRAPNPELINKLQNLFSKLKDQL